MGPMLRVRVLGGLLIEGIDRAALGSRKQRRLLARLTVAQGAAVSVDELADDLWGEDQPANPRDQVAVLVRAFGLQRNGRPEHGAQAVPLRSVASGRPAWVRSPRSLR